MNLPSRIPTLVAFFLLFSFVGGFIVLFEQITRTLSLASAQEKPLQVTLTNVSHDAFTITWVTEKETTGFITIDAAEGVPMTFLDERDGQTNKPGVFTHHSASATRLRSNTLYMITLYSNSRPFKDKLTVKTGPAIDDTPAEREPAYGTVMDAQSNPVSGALVYLTIDESQMLSTLSKTSGAWVIPLQLIREKSLSAFLPASERQTENLRVISNLGESTAITDTLNDSPVPDMAIGKTYDFRKQQAKAPSAAVLGQTTQPSGQWQIALDKPEDGSFLTTSLPMIQGKGIPGISVVITLGTKPPSVGKTTVGSDGIFRYTPSGALSPGRYTVTITTFDRNNAPVALTHTFSLFKSGTQVLGDATPSATLTPTSTQIPTPTEAIAINSPTPTENLVAQTPPTSGNALPLMLLVAVSIMFLFSGAAFLY